MKKIVLGFVAVLFGIGIAYLNQKTLIQSVSSNDVAKAIHSDVEDISLTSSIEQSDLVAEIEILEKIGEIGEEDETTLAKTIHLAKITSVLKGDLSESSKIKLLQDGVEGLLVNGVPIYQEGEKYVFVLKKAEPEEEFPNTYWAQKSYFEAEEQLISLNYGEEKELSEFEVETEDRDVTEKVNTIIEESPIDEAAVTVLDKNETLSLIEGLAENVE